MKNHTLASILCVALLAQASASAQSGEYCWKDSYGRGVGTIPTDCSYSQEKQGLLCYPKCAAGFTGVGPVCWQTCPAGFTDDGAFCRKPAAYGRGGGYPWQFQDGFSNGGMLARCQAAEGVGCEMWGAIAYPTCKAGFANFGSNICSPVCPEGMTDIGISCAKRTATRATIAAQCGGGQVYDTGLCYNSCKGGYNGVGPVCWGTCPADKPFACGAGCATNEAACAQATSDQVLSVVSAVASIAASAFTGGAGGAAIQGATNGAKVGVNTAAKTLTKSVTKATVKETLRAQALKQGKSIAESTLETWGTALATYDTNVAIYASAGQDPPDFDWASLDPTGISSIIQAYNKPVCAPPPANSPVTGLNGAPAPTSTIPAGKGLSLSQAPADWQKFPGSASDVAVTASGTAWVVSRGGPGQEHPDFMILRLKPGEDKWTRMAGMGQRIAAGGESVWILNNGRPERWNAATNRFEPMFGGDATDIAVDATGNAYIIARGRIWQLKAGESAWTYLPTPKQSGYVNSADPVRITAAGHEIVSILDSRGLDYRWVGNDPKRTPSSLLWEYSGAQEGNQVTDMATGPNGEVYQTMSWGIWVKTSTDVTPLPNPDNVLFAAVATGGKDRVWGVKTDGRIYKYVGNK